MIRPHGTLALVAALSCAASCFGAAGPKPLKVFILAGQSNMEGQAVADLGGKDYNDGKGTLKFLMRDPAKASLLKHLMDDQGQWAVRDDVWVRYKPENGPLKAGPLTLGFTVYGGRHHFGPELQFGLLFTHTLLKWYCASTRASSRRRRACRWAPTAHLSQSEPDLWDL